MLTNGPIGLVLEALGHVVGVWGARLQLRRVRWGKRDLAGRKAQARRSSGRERGSPKTYSSVCRGTLHPV